MRSKDARFIRGLAHVKLHYDTKMSKKAFGFKFREMEISLLEQCASLIKHGIVEDKTRD
jgi:hypothetical protein